MPRPIRVSQVFPRVSDKVCILLYVHTGGHNIKTSYQLISTPVLCLVDVLGSPAVVRDS